MKCLNFYDPRPNSCELENINHQQNVPEIARKVGEKKTWYLDEAKLVEYKQQQHLFL